MASGAVAVKAGSAAAAAAMPKLMYGTAWKKEKTTGLVLEALKQGFRGIDTACQPKHYSEDLVGAAVAAAIQQGILGRSGGG